ncbi:DUF2971 domain-containing protein [Vibrio sp. T20]|uniref:DUF2971 domain-containing protein n=1 Tax=Vibrio sp. T20 TaxID=2588450 RepID=UPI0011B5ED61|nr:DUF2971 domain-containing protein [Vibrio sp. T20]
MLLYHYADQNAFMSIIENKELWATKIQYLNDENEYKLALSLADEYLKELLDSAADESEEEIIEELIENIGYVNDTNICVCSLSEQGDLLSQWRGYSTCLGGYSIGFDKLALEQLAESQGFHLVKCIYDPQEQVRMVREAIDSVINEAEQHALVDAEWDVFDVGYSFREKLGAISPIIKDVSFAEESEWRLFSTRTFEELNFRAGRSMLTPYFRFSLGEDTKALIDDIIVGHTPHAELAVRSTEAFLTKNHPPVGGDYTCQFEVRPSSIPFRNW